MLTALVCAHHACMPLLARPSMSADLSAASDGAGSAIYPYLCAKRARIAHRSAVAVLSAISALGWVNQNGSLGCGPPRPATCTQVQEDFVRHSYFRAKGGAVESRAGGVMRTNCIDCLDRTNVVQGVLARKVRTRTRATRCTSCIHAWTAACPATQAEGPAACTRSCRPNAAVHLAHTMQRSAMRHGLLAAFLCQGGARGALRSAVRCLHACVPRTCTACMHACARAGAGGGAGGREPAARGRQPAGHVPRGGEGVQDPVG